MLNFKNINPKNKIILFAALFGITLSVIIFAFFNRSKNIAETLYNVSSLQIYTADLWINYNNFEKANHSDDFFEFGEDKFSEAVAKNINSLDSIFNISVQNMNKYLPEHKYKISQLKVIFDNIEKLFNASAENKVKTGNQNFGLISQHFVLENKTEILINASNNIKSKSEFTSLKNNARIFFETGAQNQSEVFNKKAENIISEIKNDTILAQDNITEALLEYKNNFNLAARLIMQNGNNRNSGYSKEISDNIADALTILKKFNDENTLNVKNKYKNYGFLAALFIIAAVTIFIFILIFAMKPDQNDIENIKLNSKNIYYENNNFLENIKNNELKNINNNLKNIRNYLFAVKNILQNIHSESFEQITNTVLPQHIIYKPVTDLKTQTETQKNKELETLQKINDEELKSKNLTLFAKILRQKYASQTDLANATITLLAQTTNSQIAGMFAVENTADGTKKLTLTASFAYNQKRMLKKEFIFGEGLIGACAVEKNTFYFENLDKDYITIVSGAGETKPRNVLIIPVLLGDEIYGVIELASLEKYNAQTVNFIETLSQDIAAAMSRFYK